MKTISLIKIASLLVLTVLLMSKPLYSSFAQESKQLSEEDKYLKTLNDRAKKIVDDLGIADAQKAERVKTIIAAQYKDLRAIHDKRNEGLKKINGNSENEKTQESDLKKIEESSEQELDKLHKKYLSKLSKELLPEQIEQVKNGMTYSVLPSTYNAYVSMIPSLTEKQKEYIKTQLAEAREHAMDAGSSEEKHKWFGKYKGKINNYLSKEGYDMKKEEKEWAKRREAQSEANKQ